MTTTNDNTITITIPTGTNRRDYIRGQYTTMAGVPIEIQCAGCATPLAFNSETWPIEDYIHNGCSDVYTIVWVEE